MFENLPGFRSFYPEECSQRNYIFRLWRQSAIRFAFQEYDAPVLEALELFKEKSGEEITEQLFWFTDKGGREVALRPEMTPSLARLVGAKAASLKRPVKWFSIGEQYRYERMQKGRLRAFYQFNVDIFGEPGCGADAELIAQCIETLRGFSLTANDVVVRLSDRELWLLFLRCYALEGDAVTPVLSIIDKMEREDPAKSIEKLTVHLGERAEHFFARTQEMSKLQDLDSIRRVLFRECEEQSAADDVRNAIEERLQTWILLLKTLDSLGASPWIRIDLGVVRGLAYYTGFVFEVFERTGKGRAIAGGGRYDHLVSKMGYNDMPACGYAMGDVTLALLLEEKKLIPPLLHKPDVYLVISGDKARNLMLGLASALRRVGIIVDYAIKEVGFGKQFKNATQSNARIVGIMTDEGASHKVLNVKDLSTGIEITVPFADSVACIQDALREGITQPEL
ncbi:MAG: histidine--tRNA ligase [Opitutales bacterium]|nr:histidine--tRNA ligase [Opitutales bacterium]